MSVTTSSQHHDPPPLLFGQRSPFTSPPLSPTHPQQIPPTMASQHNDDIDMSTSINLQRPDGQNHDRQDASAGQQELVADNDDSASESSESASEDTHSQVEQMQEQEQAQTDVMDTTLDQMNATGQAAPMIPTANPPPDDITVAPTLPPPVGQIIADVVHPPERMDDLPPPPPPPPVLHADSDSPDDSSEMDDGEWRPIREDTSTPDEHELKLIEERTERSALDHDRWERKTFTELGDPEYTPGPTGRIEWTTKYNGTQEDPVPALVSSPIVKIGGHDWQIKFYPRGNDSEYLSVYVECLTVTTESAQEERFTPVPLLPQAKDVPKKRPSVAAQVAVVMYNPAEPRVNTYKSCTHRFCPGSKDWGWTRFYGPKYEVHHRHPRQRQAMLRNDTLAFTAYIRIVNDSTGCLWEHTEKGNHWDGFAMTGLPSMSVRHLTFGSHLVTAVSLWLLLKPFRDWVTTEVVPAGDTLERPKPLFAAFQRIIYHMRVRLCLRYDAVMLDSIIDALDWYGIKDQWFVKADVVEMWDILHTKLVEEVRGTAAEIMLEGIFGQLRFPLASASDRRISVRDHKSIQAGIVNVPSVDRFPLVLTVELERQVFDKETRSWKKLNNKVKLDDEITVSGSKYALYGFAVHVGHLESRQYESVIRPNGPDGKWYTYRDARGDDVHQVACLTKRQAVDAHEGTDVASTDNARVAYAAIYVRTDSPEGLEIFSGQGAEPAWDVPSWLTEELANADPIYGSFGTATLPPARMTDEEAAEHEKRKANAADDSYEWFVVDSRAFTNHSDLGFIDVYDEKWRPGTSDFVHSIELKYSDKWEQVIANAIPGVKDPRQVIFWRMEITPERGTESAPSLMESWNEPIFVQKDPKHKRPDELPSSEPRWLWVHVVDFEDLPKIEPKPAPVAPVATAPDITAGQQEDQTNGAEGSSSAVAAVAGALTAAAVPTLGGDLGANAEDTEMRDADETDQTAVVVVPGQVPDVVMIDGEAVILPPFASAAWMVANGSPTGLPTTVAHSELRRRYLGMHGVYFFLKVLDLEMQTLTPKGGFYVHRDDRLGITIRKILGIQDQSTTLDLILEEEHEPLEPRSSFSAQHIIPGSIIIASTPPSEPTALRLSTLGNFSTAKEYLTSLGKSRNFPQTANGNLTFNYLGSEFYSGQVHHHRPHGHGTSITLSGDAYTGPFTLGTRHGSSGSITYANGDTYTGSFASSLPHGQGTYTYASSGNRYVGGFQSGKKHGKGTMYYEQAEESERLCGVCWGEEADVALQDCGHVVVCRSCAGTGRIENCPFCRARVRGWLRLWFVAS